MSRITTLEESLLATRRMCVSHPNQTTGRHMFQISKLINTIKLECFNYIIFVIVVIVLGSQD
jgi:hypothetical protein